MSSANTGESGRRITQNALEMERIRLRGALWLNSIKGVILLAAIGLSYIPLQLIYFCAQELSGKETSLTFGFTATISLVGLAAVIKAVSGHLKIKKQSEELIRLRERCEGLEKQIETLKKQLPGKENAA